MELFYLLLLLLYSTFPPISLYFTQTLIFIRKEKYAWHLHYFLKYLITLSFLPLLFFPPINLGLFPLTVSSVFILILTFIFAVVGIKPAIKRQLVHFYFGGVIASLMEEILFRGIIFGLVMAIWNDWLISIIISSLLFGMWHLKNFPWHQNQRKTWIQFLYTSLWYGPIFALMRILTGDIYLAVFFHYVTNATVTFAPNWLRGLLVARLPNNSKDS